MTQYSTHNPHQDSPEFGPRPVEHMMLSRLFTVRTNAQDLRWKVSRLAVSEIETTPERHLHLVPSIVEAPFVEPDQAAVPLITDPASVVADIRNKVRQALDEQPTSQIAEEYVDAA